MDPLVSVIIVFYNTPARFICEAIESVLGQTYRQWELFLVDDGSEPESTHAAQHYVEQYSDKVHYLDHPGHQNLGASAARQLGIDNARGKYLAFLDADDIWLPEKLEKQVSLLEEHPEAGMVYSSSLYWYSWSGNPTDRPHDYIPKLGIPPGVVIYPPQLLLLFLKGKAAIPCPCSILVRRDIVQKVGGFVKEFRGVIDDQVFYAKICLNTPVFAVDECWDYYRQHSASTTAVIEKAGMIYSYHLRYLNWLSDYLKNFEIDEGLKYIELWNTIYQEIWIYKKTILFGRPLKNQNLFRWIKKWVLRFERAIFPIQVQHSIGKRLAKIKNYGNSQDNKNQDTL
jgi:glycosyltransferase involved in cell wall biosynthesis